MNAAVVPANQSLNEFLFNSLGYRYSIGLMFATVLAVSLAYILVRRGRNWATGPAMLFAVSMPVIIGALGTVEGFSAGFYAMAGSNVTPTMNELAYGCAANLVPLLLGIVAMGPGFLVALLGLVTRAIRNDATSLAPLANQGS